MIIADAKKYVLGDSVVLYLSKIDGPIEIDILSWAQRNTEKVRLFVFERQLTVFFIHEYIGVLADFFR